MKEKDIKTIVKSVQRVWLCKNAASEWEIHFSVSYQEEVEKLTSYYPDGETGEDKTRSWLDLGAAVKKLEKLFPKVTEVTIFLRPGVKYETARKVPRSP